VSLGARLAAAANEGEACGAAAERGQQLRDEHHYAKARVELLSCMRDVCPDFVRKDCTDWLAALDVSQPTIVVGARDSKGQDVVAVRVLSDGTQLATSLDGTAVRIDPGQHTLRFEVNDGRFVEQKVLIREGEKNRAITVDLSGAKTPASPATPPSPEPTAPTRSTFPTGPVVLGGVGLAAIGVFAVLGSTGMSDLSHLRSTCGVDHSCSQSAVDGTHTKLVVGDIALLGGVLAVAGAGTWYLVSRPSRTESTGWIGIHIAAGPTSIAPTLSGAF
jgi:hypothetical protein